MNFYNKSFSNPLESDDVEIDTLQQRIKWWKLVFGRGGPTPNDLYDYTFNDFYMLYRIAIDPDMQDLVKALRDRDNIPVKEKS